MPEEIATGTSSLPFQDLAAGNGSMEFHRVYLHPCIIGNQPCIIYPQELEAQNPEFLHRLRQHYTALGYALKKDRRTSLENSSSRHERRRWASLLLFTAILLIDGGVYAESTLEIHDPADHRPHSVELHMVSNPPMNLETDGVSKSLSQHTERKSSSLTSPVAIKLFDFLHERYQRRDKDPGHLLDDLREIANYYSAFPEAITILEALENKNLHLVYDEKEWKTVASGSFFNVDKAVIHFNTRAAAQLRFNTQCKENPLCIASPADALLHELLHAHSMLVETENFISQGGMNSVIYPYKHEYAVIKSERGLYASMSKRDEIQRPQRSDHTGRAVQASCPTCIK